MLVSLYRSAATKPVKSLLPQIGSTTSISAHNLIARRYKSDDAIEEETTPHTDRLMSIISDSLHTQTAVLQSNEQYRVSRGFFRKGDIYKPSDLNDSKPTTYAPPPKPIDELKVLKLNPIVEYKNAALLSHYISPLGRLLSREQTGLSAKNQRRLSKAVRQISEQQILSDLLRSERTTVQKSTSQRIYGNQETTEGVVSDGTSALPLGLIVMEFLPIVIFQHPPRISYYKYQAQHGSMLQSSTTRTRRGIMDCSPICIHHRDYHHIPRPTNQRATSPSRTSSFLGPLQRATAAHRYCHRLLISTNGKETRTFSTTRQAYARTSFANRSSRVSASAAVSGSSASIPAPKSTFPPSISSILSTVDQSSMSSNPIRLGRKRRNLVAMHQLRLQQQSRVMGRSVPRHSSQLMGMNGGMGTAARTGRSRKKKPVPRQGRWRPSLMLDPETQMQTPRYQHVHYYLQKGYRKRIRFLGFQHFLRHSRANSSEVQRAILRERYKVFQRAGYPSRTKNAKFSWRRPFVKLHRKKLNRLQRLIAQREQHFAIREARTLIHAKQRGAEQPSPARLAALTAMDRNQYMRSQTVPRNRRLRRSRTVSRNRRLQRFTTMDYNVILETCQELKAWGHGYKIARILLGRYWNRKFDFRTPDIAAPNTNTIHLMALMFIKFQRPNRVMWLLSALKGRYQQPIPQDVYASFLNQLSSIPGNGPYIESVLVHMRKYGPAPNATLYNTLVKAIGYDESLNQAEAVLRWMESRGCKPDKQSYRILMDVSLKELDMTRAQYWLAEYQRQGFEITPRMLEPYMKTCIQQVIQSNGHSTKHKSKRDSYSQEWMYKSLQLLQFLSSQRLTPTAVMFELLIEGLLSRQNFPEAKRTFYLMRSSPHLYTPGFKTWNLFFDYHLSMKDYHSAIWILNEMRRANIAVGQMPTKDIVPTDLYHKLFRHVMRDGKVTLAERNLYEMLIHQKRAPYESEIIDLIWELEKQPGAAERVYDLLYAQIVPSNGDDLDIRALRSNSIIDPGPIQLANVGVMRAKASSMDAGLQEEVWKTWNSMTHYFLGYEDLQNDTNKITAVLALAFEQVADATRGASVNDHGLQAGSQKRGTKAMRRQEQDGWDFNPGRRGPGMGLGLGLALGFGQESDKTATPGLSPTFSSIISKPWEFAGEHRTLIQKLLKDQDVLQPLLKQRDTFASTMTKSRSAASDSNHRLHVLKSSFEWVKRHQIPIRINGLNAYLVSLISHQDYVTVQDTVKRFLLNPNMDAFNVNNRGSEDSFPRSLSLSPDLDTLRILNGSRDLIQDGRVLADQVLLVGGSELCKEWVKHLENRRLQGNQTPRPRDWPMKRSSSAVATSRFGGSPDAPM
ncbi:hypothetical protein BG011_003389 [Mortierella polycephala]|uniref:Small ribosomal subunit protein bS18m n=1 Tax=Mortierella polycephala TaxID=41804 RepID=A0A9P6Q342_9FUNG|nr:hypothetical protein BG011_003389 [Mortierella polycephala]